MSTNSKKITVVGIELFRKKHCIEDDSDQIHYFKTLNQNNRKGIDLYSETFNAERTLRETEVNEETKNMLICAS